MSEEKPLTVQDLVEALENRPLKKLMGIKTKYYSTNEIDEYFEKIAGLVAKLKKQLQEIANGDAEEWTFQTAQTLAEKLLGEK